MWSHVNNYKTLPPLPPHDQEFPFVGDARFIFLWMHVAVLEDSTNKISTVVLKESYQRELPKIVPKESHQRFCQR